MRVVIVSGYFNPLHIGHLELIKSAKNLADKLIVVVNNDKQQQLKKNKIIINEKERMSIVSAIRYVDKAILSIDEDLTINKTLIKLSKKLKNHELIFANGGDRSSTSEISETKVCTKYNIEMLFGIGGNKKLNSSTNINSLLEKETLVKHVQKVWGYEDWLVNNNLYCGKILHVQRQHCCSYHYHKLKDETFYILKGHVVMELNNNRFDMLQGDVVRIKPGDKHRFFGIDDTDIIEISTRHFDSDSHRLIKSGRCYEKEN